jgi:uncharacterized membrane protein
MPTPIIAYIATVIVFFAIDFVWLGFVAKDLYQNQIGFLLKDQFNMPVAAGFYFMYVIGIVYFAVNPALQVGDWKLALLNGALFGFFAYATYDLTNLATLKDWPVKVVLVDIAWGAFITGVSATGGCFISQLIFKNFN